MLVRVQARGATDNQLAPRTPPYWLPLILTGFGGHASQNGPGVLPSLLHTSLEVSP
jgi:hypothetical protein